MNISDLETRPIELANYILDNNATIRATAKVYGMAKSTVHHDLSTKLKYIDYSLFKRVQRLLINNFKIKHLHGGESTKLKYLKLKEEINKNDEFDNIIC